VICLLRSCLVYNSNGTRQLTCIESKNKKAVVNFFTSAATGYQHKDGSEFIAVGTSSGEIYYAEISGGGSFVKELGY